MGGEAGMDSNSQIGSSSFHTLGRLMSSGIFEDTAQQDDATTGPVKVLAPSDLSLSIEALNTPPTDDVDPSSGGFSPYATISHGDLSPDWSTQLRSRLARKEPVKSLTTSTESSCQQPGPELTILDPEDGEMLIAELSPAPRHDASISEAAVNTSAPTGEIPVSPTDAVPTVLSLAKTVGQEESANPNVMGGMAPTVEEHEEERKEAAGAPKAPVLLGNPNSTDLGADLASPIVGAAASCVVVIERAERYPSFITVQDDPPAAPPASTPQREPRTAPQAPGVQPAKPAAIQAATTAAAAAVLPLPVAQSGGAAAIAPKGGRAGASIAGPEGQGARAPVTSGGGAAQPGAGRATAVSRPVQAGPNNTFRSWTSVIPILAGVALVLPYLYLTSAPQLPEVTSASTGGQDQWDARLLGVSQTKAAWPRAEAAQREYDPFSCIVVGKCGPVQEDPPGGDGSEWAGRDQEGEGEGEGGPFAPLKRLWEGRIRTELEATADAMDRFWDWVANFEDDPQDHADGPASWISRRPPQDKAGGAGDPDGPPSESEAGWDWLSSLVGMRGGGTEGHGNADTQGSASAAVEDLWQHASDAAGRVGASLDWALHSLGQTVNAALTVTPSDGGVSEEVEKLRAEVATRDKEIDTLWEELQQLVTMMDKATLRKLIEAKRASEPADAPGADLSTANSGRLADFAAQRLSKDENTPASGITFWCIHIPGVITGVVTGFVLSRKYGKSLAM